jgi:hypothetical protein
LDNNELRAVQRAFETGTKGVIIGKQRKEIQRLFTVHKCIIDKKGNLRDDYVSVINFQSAKQNRGIDSKEELALKKAYESFLNSLGDSILDIPGSSTTRQKIERVIVDAASPAPSNKIKVTKARSKNTKLKTTTKSTKNPKTSKGSVSLSKAKGRKVRRSKTSHSSPLFLLGILNQQLPHTVRQNMGEPALNNRTGRFASSVRVTDITSTTKGYPSIGYTYQRSPYETFELGGQQGSAARDPRKLIDISIREIAAKYAIGRFYTRRM